MASQEHLLNVKTAQKDMDPEFDTRIFNEQFFKSEIQTEKMPEFKESYSEFDRQFDEYVKPINREVQNFKSHFNFFLKFSWEFSKKAFPVSVVYCIYMMINVTNILFVSNSEISKNDDKLLYGVNLGMSMYYMFGISISFGISSSLDTFCTNAYGAKLYYLMGCYFNRARVILTLVYIPIFFLLFFAESILFSLGQEQIVAQHAGNFLRGVLPGTIFFFWIDASRRFIAAQGVFISPIFCVILTSILHPLWVYLFFIRFDMGAFGSGLACTITNILNFILIQILLKVYAIKESYFFINKDSFVDWGQFFKIAFPSMLMMCLETWNYQIVNFMVGYLKDTTQENSLSLIISFTSIIYMFPFGLSVASSTIVSQLIGDFATKKSEVAVKLILIFTLIFSFFIGIVLMIIKNYFPLIYTDDPKVIDLISNVFWLYIFYEFVEFLTTSYTGIYRGLGMQNIVALANFICYYIISLPCSYLLTFTFEMGIYGVWIAYILAIVSLIVFYGLIHYYKVNYFKICKETNKRLSRDSFSIGNSKNNSNEPSTSTSLDSSPKKNNERSESFLSQKSLKTIKNLAQE